MLKILFDATILASGTHKNSNRSGIFVAALGIFSALARRTDVELGVYSSPSFVDPVNTFLDQCFPGRGFRVIGRSRSTVLGRLWDSLVECRPTLPVKALKLVVKVAYVLYDKYLVGDSLAEEVRGYDAFLSPVHLPPRFIRKRVKILRYTVLHDTIPMIYPQFSPFTLLGFSWTFDLIRNLDGNDRAFANSECTKRDYLRFAKGLRADNVEVIPLAADAKFHKVDDGRILSLVRRKYGIPQERRYLLSLCTIEPRKNLDFALRAFVRYLRESGDESSVFVLAGGKWGRFAKKWAGLLEEFGDYGDRIVQIGYVDDEDIAAVYSGATAFIYPSLYEGFGLPPLEAMSCGTPVITSNVSSIPEVVGDAAICIDPTDLAAAADAISRMFSNDRERAEYIKCGLERSRLFSWDRAAEIIIGRIGREGKRGLTPMNMTR